MAFISAKNLIYKIKKRNENNEVTHTDMILNHISLDIEEGEFVAVVGRNGSGKSTFARHLNALLYADEGTLIIDGNDVSEVDKLWDIRKACGMVFQNPDNQIVGVTLEEDVAFGLENLEVESTVMNEIVNDSLKRVGLSEYKTRTTNELSGGQKQRLSISSVLAMKPKCIVFDEVTSMLDPKGRRDVLDIIYELNRTEHITVVYITHDMNEIVDADRIYLIDDGVCKFNGTARQLFEQPELVKSSGLKLPTVTELSWRLYQCGCLSRYNILSREELLEEYVRYNNKELSDKKENQKLRDTDLEQTPERASNQSSNQSSDVTPILKLRDLGYKYSQDTNMTLSGVNLDIYENEFIGIAGHTGSGKSTLMQILDGLYKKTEGNIYFHGKDIDDEKFDKKNYHFHVGLVFQYPESQLFEETVLKDVMYGPLNMGMSQDDARQIAEDTLKKLGISPKDFDKSPFQMSGGEKRKVAIAGVFAMNTEVIILDEPTAGLDAVSRDRLFELLYEFHQTEKKTILVVSHSMEDIAKYADRVIVMNQGKKVLDEETRTAFANTDIITNAGLDVPEINKIMTLFREHGIIQENMVLTVDEAVKLLD